MSDEPAPAGPVDVGVGTTAPPPRRSGRAVRVSAFPILILAFLLLAGAAAAAAWGQFKTGKGGPVVSMALSAGAVVLTAIALWLRPRP